MVLKYRGYLSGPLDLDPVRGVFSGTVANLKDAIHFEGDTADELSRSFRNSIDDYLALCSDRGERAERPTVVDILAQHGPEADFEFAPPKMGLPIPPAPDQGQNFDGLRTTIEKGTNLSGKPDRESLFDQGGTASFIAYIRKTADNDYEVKFPDLPYLLTPPRSVAGQSMA